MATLLPALGMMQSALSDQQVTQMEYLLLVVMVVVVMMEVMDELEV